MKMRVDELKMRVRAKIDELGPNDSDMIDLDKDNKELDTMIRNAVTDALRYLLMHVNGDMIEGVPCKADVTVDDNGVGTVRVPDDCLRVLNIRLKSWKSGAPDIVSENSSVYSMQHDKYSRGIPERPVVAMVKKQDGRYLELYSTDDKNDELSSFSYLRIPQIEKSPIGDEIVDVPSVLENALVYYVAGLTVMGYKDFELGEHFISLAKEFI